MPTKIVYFEDVDWMMTKINEINKVDFDTISWCSRDRRLNISQEDLDAFKKIGLNNIDFIAYYRQMIE